MRTSIHGHYKGEVWVSPKLITEVRQVLGTVEVKIVTGAAKKLREAILKGLLSKGWSGEVSLSMDSDITITSAKERVGLCLQTGNMARVYADLLKLEKLTRDGAIIAGIMIVPSMPCAKKLGSNIANSDRLLRELKIFERVITAPLAIFSLE